MGRMQDKVALVLGAAAKDNMGQAVARRLASEGAKVVVAGRHEAPLKDIAAEIGGDYAICDITKRADIEAAKDKSVATFGGCHAAINTVGWAPLSPILEAPEEQIDALMDIQFKGTYFFLQVFGKYMSENGGGTIVHLSTATSYCLIDDHAAYIGTKAGADRLVRCFANELGSQGVKINAIAPGLTETGMTSGALTMPGLKDAFAAKYPLGRIGTVDDIANAALWLSTDESFMTGQILQINGGLTLRSNPTKADVSAAMAAAMTGQTS
jgi:NAD(P)-dependent dehydrogenase (short-subunit alcohol dehydrogenase family)